MSLIANPAPQVSEEDRRVEQIRSAFITGAQSNLAAYRQVREALQCTPEMQAAVQTKLGADAAKLPAIAANLRAILVATDPSLGDQFDAITADTQYVAPAPDPAPNAEESH